MRYIMKGGVWKNSEDEILKAAIMKYGLNQWSRISSLLQRKSAKQCKQRWYQWLDPSIKKTEWTRAQDEKLLQLARVFPSQWRTIAPFVGRTPTQCYDRYEKLLDIAQGKNSNDPNDLRKLRPGEIDPNPETKPARPDPIDMDEDEKEMLAEVRVRLANTKGKKAKRKEREKIIDEARRLAQLQKARQLKMAGVQNIITQQELKRLKQKKDIDYNKEVPFKREVPDFVYKTEQNQTPASSAFALNITMQAMQGKKKEIDQQINRKIDKRRLKKYKQKDISVAIMQKRELAKPPPVPINLPTPQLGDKQLQELKKFNITTPLNTHLVSQTPFGMTPQNKIMLSAQLNVSLNYKDIADEDEQDTLEKLRYMKAIEERDEGKRPAEIRVKPISQRIRTPLNEWQKQDQGKLMRLLKRLPKPENQIQFEIPEEVEEEEKEEIMDAEEHQRQEQAKQRMEQEEMLRNRSEVLKKGLPRLRTIPQKVYFHKSNALTSLIEKQYISLVYSDAVDFPLEEGVQLPDREIAYKEHIPKEYLQEAQSLISQEMSKDQNPYRYSSVRSIQLHHKVKLNGDSMDVSVKEHEVAEDMAVRYKANHPQYLNQLKKSNLLEKKCAVTLAGFEKIIKERTQQVNNLIESLMEAQNQRKSLEKLREQEQRALQSRIEEMQNYYKIVYDSL